MPCKSCQVGGLSCCTVATGDQVMFVGGTSVDGVGAEFAGRLADWLICVKLRLSWRSAIDAS